MSVTISVRIQKAVTRLFATKYGVLGSLLTLCGVIGLIEFVLKPGLESAALAVVFLVLAMVLLSVHAGALHRDRVLLQTGCPVTGQVDGTLDGVLMHSGPVVYKRHYSVRFHYAVNGTNYTGRSRFSWTAPLLPPDGKLTVYIDPADPRRCAVDLWAL